MLKNLISEFNESTTLGKLNTLSSIFTISGVSLLTIFSALGGINFMQMAIGFLVFGFIFLFVALLLFLTLSCIEVLKGKLNPVVMLLVNIAMFLILIGFVFFCVFVGTDLIKSFKDA